MHKVFGRLLVLACVPVFGSSLLAVPPRSGEADESALLRAIRADDLATVKMIAADHTSVTATDKMKATPLHFAALYGGPASMRILLAAGADPNAHTESGATPLIYAAWNFEMVRLLVDQGADVNATENGGVSPLMVAASAYGNLATVRYLIEKGASVKAVDNHGTDALMRSTVGSEVEVQQYLLAHGANAYLANKAGITALAGALASVQPDSVRLLLAAGSDPNAFNTFAGQVRKGPIALTHLTPLMLAGPAGDPDSVRILLSAGAHANDLDSRRMSPLMFAVASDHANVNTVHRLIAAGADVNAKDQNGESVLVWARKFGDPQIIATLEAAGAQGELAAPAVQAPAAETAKTAHEAVQRAVPLLARSGSKFFQEGGCAGCHHQPLQAQVYVAARQAGLQPDAALRQGFMDSMLATRPVVSPGLRLLMGPGGDYDTLLSYIDSLASLGEPRSELTDLIVHYVAARQTPSGAWIRMDIARPPIEESSITKTAMAIRALQSYGWPARHAEFAERIQRAQAWLLKAHPVTNYERAEKIDGLYAAGVGASELRDEAALLIAQQRSDGGWSQTRFLGSDAYATGLVLHVLYKTGLSSPADVIYKKGVAYLLRSQFGDGSWYVRSRAPKFQPYFQSGFPHNHDQWISSSATALAAMALAPAASEGRH